MGKSRHDHCLGMSLFTLLALLVSISFLSCANTPVTREIEIYHAVQFEAVLDSLGLSMADWQAGIREVPRAFLIGVPHRWSEIAVTEVDVAGKKRIFYRALLPLVLRAQEIITEERSRVVELAERLRKGKQLSDADREWLMATVRRYGLRGDPAGESTEADLQQLLAMVDIVPASLALAQADYETGDGTSRFAGLGNALYGQWAWGEGMRPEGQRAEKGDHRIAAFANPLESTLAYMHNLNSHSAYAEFRRRRAEQRDRGHDLDGYQLAGALQSYSERGEEYVATLRNIMQVNGLKQADKAILRDEEPVYLVPVSLTASSD